MGHFPGIITFIPRRMRTWGLWKYVFLFSWEHRSILFSSPQSSSFPSISQTRQSGLSEPGGGRGWGSGKRSLEDKSSYDAVMRFPGKISKLYS